MTVGTFRQPGRLTPTLAVVRRILTLSARLWRHENGLSWLETVPLIQMVKGPKRQAHPLTFEEQQRLFLELPEHPQLIATFAVHTGLRDEELRALRWNWMRGAGNVTFFYYRKR